MGRSIAAVFAGLIAGIALMTVIQIAGMIVIPLPEGVDPKNPESLKAAMAAGKIPLASLIAVLISHATGSFFAGWLCARIARTSPLRLAGMVGVVLLAAGIVNLMSIPHPAWFAVVDVLLYIPCAYFGGTLAPEAPAPTAPEA